MKFYNPKSTSKLSKPSSNSLNNIKTSWRLKVQRSLDCKGYWRCTKRESKFVSANGMHFWKKICNFNNSLYTQSNRWTNNACACKNLWKWLRKHWLKLTWECLANSLKTVTRKRPPNSWLIKLSNYKRINRDCSRTIKHWHCRFKILFRVIPRLSAIIL